jgi:hypothetical protein
LIDTDDCRGYGRRKPRNWARIIFVRIDGCRESVVSNDRSELRWGVEQRLEFIEFRLFWEGHVNRSDVMEQFGLSVNQASSDLSRYISLAPHNMDYDRSLRTYVRQSGFKPVFDKLDAGRYLAQLRSVADGILDQDDCWIAGLPDYDFAPTPARGVDSVILRSVIDAIRRFEAIEVQYQSLSRPEPIWRWIAPHAMAFDGFRWHTRAFCLLDKCFKDFLLSRVLDTRGSRPSPSGSAADKDWAEQVDLVIGPHPDLSDTQRRVVELDYGMNGGSATITVRRALLYYALRRLGLDSPPCARKPEEQQIVLLASSAEVRRAETEM